MEVDQKDATVDAMVIEHEEPHIQAQKRKLGTSLFLSSMSYPYFYSLNHLSTSKLLSINELDDDAPMSPTKKARHDT